MNDVITLVVLGAVLGNIIYWIVFILYMRSKRK